MRVRISRRGTFVLSLVGVSLALAATSAWSAEDGKAIYEKSCKSCHSIAGEGGKMKAMGGPLDGVGSKRDAAWLKAYLSDPKSQIPTAKMPKLPLNPEQLEATIQFMSSLKK